MKVFQIPFIITNNTNRKNSDHAFYKKTIINFFLEDQGTVVH